MKEVFLADYEIDLILRLLPRPPVPVGRPPMFYRTGTYEGDLKLQQIADDLREKLREDA